MQANLSVALAETALIEAQMKEQKFWQRMGQLALMTDATKLLRGAGYTDQRWYAIGARYAHGFAVATRLEHVAESGAANAERWSPQYPDAANLLWLDGATNPRLPGPGRYRVVVVAYTDLPLADAHRAPLWNEQTWMTEDAPPVATVTQHRAARPSSTGSSSP